jgi:hypothetical protein
LVSQQRLVKLGVAHGPGPVAGLGQRRHEGDGRGRVHRPDRHQPFPPLDAVAQTALRLRPLRELPQRRRRAVLKPRSLRRAPLLELGRARQEEAVEEWTLVERRDTLELASRERGLEALNIARQAGRIEPDVPAGDEQVVDPERTTAIVQRLRHRLPGSLRTRLGPQQAGHFFPAQPAIPGDSQERQERQKPALTGRAAERRTSPVAHEDGAKCPQFKHFAVFEVRLRSRQDTVETAPLPSAACTRGRGSGDAPTLAGRARGHSGPPASYVRPRPGIGSMPRRFGHDGGRTVLHEASRGGTCGTR